MIPIACSFVFMALDLTFRDEARLCSLRPARSVCIHVDEFAIDIYTIGHARNLPPRLAHSLAKGQQSHRRATIVFSPLFLYTSVAPDLPCFQSDHKLAEILKPIYPNGIG